MHSCKLSSDVDAAGLESGLRTREQLTQTEIFRAYYSILGPLSHQNHPVPREFCLFFLSAAMIRTCLSHSSLSQPHP